MKYQTKAIIIGRKGRIDKEDMIYRPCFISLFDMNDPHKQNIVPKKILDFTKTKRVDIEGLDMKFMLMGGDLVINDLEYIEVSEKDGNVKIKGKQK